MACTCSEVDTVTQRPRTPNDQYTHLTDEQVKNIKKDVSPFFHTVSKESSIPKNGPPREGGRYYRDRYCDVTSEHLVRGVSGTQPFGWINHQWSRHPPEAYNTCRGRASVRWGPNKAGERTRSHFFGESTDRYTNIDMYRRNPTNYPGRVVMDHGRAADGYYAQKYPSRTTWFGAGMPLNRTDILGSVHTKTQAEYDENRKAEQSARLARNGEWPEYSEYTDKFLDLSSASKVLPPISRPETGGCIPEKQLEVA